MPETREPRLVFQPAACRSMQRGINKLVEAIRPTLGPLPRTVAIDRVLDRRMPELLDDGGAIAKRITRLPDPAEDTGAMLVRDFLWRLQDQAGDGTATGAVLFQSVYNRSVRYLASGGNPVRVRFFLERGMRAVIDQLAEMTVHLEGRKKLAQVAGTLCRDARLAGLLGEIFDIIGEYGRLEIRPGRGLTLEREYVEGMYWERGVVSRNMLADGGHARTEMQDTAILISDLKIEDPLQLRPVINLALRSGIQSLLVIAGEYSERAIGMLLANSHPEKLHILAVRLPGWDAEEQAWTLEDLSVLTGGRPFVSVTGDTFRGMRPDDFGRARRVWADRFTFGIVGGGGDPRTLRRHISRLRACCESTTDPVLHDKLRARVGKLLGGTAVLRLGGETELEIETRKELAKHTAAVMRAAMLSGVLPGGGTALLMCRPLVARMLARSTDPDERAACWILRETLEEPMRTIIHNAGGDAGRILAEIEAAGPGHGYDARSGRVVRMMEAGIWDAAAVVESAFYGAVSTAGLALTVDVLVHRRHQPSHATIRLPAPRKQLKTRQPKPAVAKGTAS
ncbi:MAG: chaperonin GroEL [Spirochaetota bacterium]